MVWDVRTPYLFGPVRHAFQSDYVLCFGGRFSDAMDADPHFRRVLPPADGLPAARDAITVHEVARERHRAFVMHLEVASVGGWQPKQNTQGMDDAKRSPYLGLGSARRVASALECETVRPSAAELARLRGAGFLGVGGGPALLVLWNGRRLFARDDWHESRDLDKVFALPRPLAATDRIEVKVCRGDAAPMGVALSFWTRAELDELCRWKKLPAPAAADGRFADRAPAYCGIARAEKIAD